MRATGRARRTQVMRAGLLAVAALTLGAVVVARQQTGPSPATLRATLTAQAEKTVFSDRCAECHRSEATVWATTKHKKGFDELHTRESAKKIYAAMGLSVIKRGTEETTPACLQCHYSASLNDGQLRAKEGVTCESCHGPARDWIGVHNNYGVQGVDFQQAAKQETPEHRTQRITQARAAGMRRPSDLYDVAANCFACHTVPNEELVNKGGHSTGSSSLDFLSASQGPMRHNFLQSFKTGDGKTNAERSPERKRLLFTVGRMVNLEYSLRAAAQATNAGRFSKAIAERVDNAADNVKEILDAVPVAELTAALTVQKSVGIRVNNRAALVSAADRIRDLTRQWLTHADGAKMSAIDPLWNDDAPAAVEAQTAALPAAPEPAVVTPVREANPRPGTTPAPAPPAPTSASISPVPVAEVGPKPADSQPVQSAGRQYPVNTRPAWRAAPKQAYLPDVPCTGCHSDHGPQITWWTDDPHSRSIKPLRSGDQKYAAIAKAYGIQPGSMADAAQICVWCHGTATTKSATVRNSVDCQQCHGAGAAFKEPHQKGYAEGVAAGLTDLKNPNVRAATCAGCHYITDPGLVAAGHRNGANFDIVKATNQIKHWGSSFNGKAADIAPAKLVAAHAQVVSARGDAPAEGGTRRAAAAPVAPPAPPPTPITTPAGPPVPPVVTPAAPVPLETPLGNRENAKGSPVPLVSPVVPVTSPGVPAVSPEATGSTAAVVPVPSPGVQERAPAVVQSPEEQLLELKKRLEALYRRRTGRGGGGTE